MAMDSIMGDLLSKEGIFDIMDFEYLAYGNARKTGSTIECQHGAEECLGNMAETCVKNMTGNAPLKYIPFDKCVEKGYSISQSTIKSCAEEHSMDYSALMSCMTGPLGKQLMDVEAKRTAANFAGKPRQYVPYFTLNGDELPQGESSVLEAVCKYWKGEKPAACRGVGSEAQRCYKQ
eukprot:TRINITY_DN1868_c0_g3_i3.p1 TRINITY_DN1868_c0_g3~~TRINITY_DN1868_c0_g3_i3.p1  ORF type:complete len:177 (+),score=95.40 TRINITY_DN1868_c0_g3_i3:157-687(+)